MPPIDKATQKPCCFSQVPAASFGLVNKKDRATKFTPTVVCPSRAVFNMPPMKLL